MPTPLSSVQQCLTPESSKVLDEAVGVARRRNHAQTTSLHVVSALLALPSAGFRDACVRSRFIYPSNRLHSRALELSLGVALDRLPSSHCDDPPISNSLMAAIKRAQAIQRRFSADVAAATAAATAAVQTYQQPLSSVKVGLQQLILSILDDPIVSRVMADAGFRSNDVKLAVERPYPPPRFFHHPPLFLYNLQEFGPAAASTADGFGHCSRKLADILMAQKKRNPLLLSMVSGAGDGLVHEFVASVEKGAVAEGINGSKVVSLEKELTGRDAESVKSKVEEIEEMMEGCKAAGVLLNLGDLKSLVDGASLGSSSFVIFVVSEIARLVGARRSAPAAGKRLWLLATATYETFMQCQTWYPSLEDDWDLYPLPISSLRPPPRLFPKSSLMESFVPFGGLFATAAELKVTYSSPYEPSIYQPQSEKYEAVRFNESSLPRAESDSLPSWLQGVSSTYTVMASGSALAKDDNVVLNAEPHGLPKKPTDAHQQIHNNPLMHKSDTYRSASCLDFGSLHDVGRKEMTTARSHSTDMRIQNRTQQPHAQLEIVPKESVFLGISSLNSESEENQQPKLPKSGRRIDQQNGLSAFHTALLPDAPPCSKIPVTTELALGMPFTLGREEESVCLMQKGHFNNPSSGMVEKVDEIGQIPHPATHSFYSGGVDIAAREVITVPWSSPPITRTSRTGELPARHSDGFTNVQDRKAAEFDSQFDSSYFKTLWKDLEEMVGRQSKAVETLCHTIVNCRVGKEQPRRGAGPKGDIWLCFLGEDHVGKRKVASALADTLFGGTKNFISVNLSFQGVAADSNSIFDLQEIDGYDTRFRGKTTVDYIAEEISKKPLSIIFLENVDKADFLVRNSLSHAIRTGKFPDSRGREIRINNSIVVMTARATKGKKCVSDNISKHWSESNILKAKAWEMQILVGIVHKDHVSSKQEIAAVFNKRSWNDRGQQDQGDSLELPKRLHRSPSMPFDLNVPLEDLEEESNPVDSSHNSGDPVSENDEAWIDDFEDLLDDTVEFEPFDFDNLADEILKKMTGRLHSILGRQTVLEIDPRVMDQILASVWLSDRKDAFDDWVEHVLSGGFLEVRQKHGTATTMVVKLVAGQNRFLKKVPGSYLPTKISIF